MSRRLASEDYFRKISSDFSLTENQDAEIQALMVKFLCIRISGYIEVFIKERIINFVEARKSHKVISSYIQSALKNLTNLNHEKLEAFLKSFSSDWATHYSSHVTDEMKSSLGSIYTNRNNIAHGGNDSLSLATLKNHFKNVVDLLKVVDESISK